MTLCVDRKAIQQKFDREKVILKFPFQSVPNHVSVHHKFDYIDSNKLFHLLIVPCFIFTFAIIQNQEIHVPPELLESHDTDEMEMSDDDETAPSHLRYGKRLRQDNKVSLISFLNRFSIPHISCFFFVSRSI